MQHGWESILHLVLKMWTQRISPSKPAKKQDWPSVLRIAARECTWTGDPQAKWRGLTSVSRKATQAQNRRCVAALVQLTKPAWTRSMWGAWHTGSNGNLRSAVFFSWRFLHGTTLQPTFHHLYSQLSLDKSRLHQPHPGSQKSCLRCLGARSWVLHQPAHRGFD